MKIRHPALIHSAAYLGSWAIRRWLGTLRWSYHPEGPNADPTRPGQTGRFIFVIWHEYVTFPIYRFAHANAYLLVSKHADGTIFSEVARQFGHKLVRGSTTHGGTEAIRQLLRLSRTGVHLAITPDGPRGPRRQVKTGVIYLAARTGMPIVPIGIGVQDCYRLRSWDRFAVPRLRTRCAITSGQPIVVPRGADREQLESYRQVVEDEMLRLGERADSIAATGRPPTAAERRAAA